MTLLFECARVNSLRSDGRGGLLLATFFPLSLENIQHWTRQAGPKTCFLKDSLAALFSRRSCHPPSSLFLSYSSSSSFTQHPRMCFRNREDSESSFSSTIAPLLLLIPLQPDLITRRSSSRNEQQAFISSFLSTSCPNREHLARLFFFQKGHYVYMIYSCVGWPLFQSLAPCNEKEKREQLTPLPSSSRVVSRRQLVIGTVRLQWPGEKMVLNGTLFSKQTRFPCAPPPFHPLSFLLPRFDLWWVIRGREGEWDWRGGEKRARGWLLQQLQPTTESDDSRERKGRNQCLYIGGGFLVFFCFVFQSW